MGGVVGSMRGGRRAKHVAQTRASTETPATESAFLTSEQEAAFPDASIPSAPRTLLSQLSDPLLDDAFSSTATDYLLYKRTRATSMLNVATGLARLFRLMLQVAYLRTSTLSALTALVNSLLLITVGLQMSKVSPQFLSAYKALACPGRRVEHLVQGVQKFSAVMVHMATGLTVIAVVQLMEAGYYWEPLILIILSFLSAWILVRGAALYVVLSHEHWRELVERYIPAWAVGLVASYSLRADLFSYDPVASASDNLSDTREVAMSRESSTVPQSPSTSEVTTPRAQARYTAANGESERGLSAESIPQVLHQSLGGVALDLQVTFVAAAAAVVASGLLCVATIFGKPHDVMKGVLGLVDLVDWAALAGLLLAASLSFRRCHRLSPPRVAAPHLWEALRVERGLGGFFLNWNILASIDALTQVVQCVLVLLRLMPF